METARNFVLDNAEISFTDYNEMRAFVEEREKNTEWLEQGVRELFWRAARGTSARRCMPKRCTSRRRLLRTRWPEPG